MSVVLNLVAAAAAVPLLVWAAATLIPDLYRRRRPLVAATAVLAVAAAAAGIVSLTSTNVLAILVAGPVALIALGLLVVIVIGIGVLAVRQVVLLTRALVRFRRGAQLLAAGDSQAAAEIFRGIAAAPAARRSLRGVALNNLGAALSQTGRYAEARAALEESLGTRTTRARRALILYNLAWVAFLERDFQAAAARNRESMAATRDGPDLRALTGMMAGRLAARTGDFGAADAALAEAAAAAAATPNPERRAQVEMQRGIVDYLRGDHEAGRSRITATLTAFQRPEARHLAALWLAGLSAVAEERDRELLLQQANDLEGRDLAADAAELAAYVRA